MHIMKRSTKAILPTTYPTLAQKVSSVLRLSGTRCFKAVAGLLLLFAVACSQNTFAAATRTGTLSAGTVPAAGGVICKGAASQVIYSFKFVQSGNSNTLN